LWVLKHQEEVHVPDKYTNNFHESPMKEIVMNKKEYIAKNKRTL